MMKSTSRAPKNTLTSESMLPDSAFRARALERRQSVDPAAYAIADVVEDYGLYAPDTHTDAGTDPIQRFFLICFIKRWRFRSCLGVSVLRRPA